MAASSRPPELAACAAVAALQLVDPSLPFTQVISQLCPTGVLKKPTNSY
jgi:hypothetical protein